MGDLSWLRFVSYLLYAVAAILYVIARTETHGLGRPIHFVLAALSLFTGVFLSDVREAHQMRHSPRNMVVGHIWSLYEANRHGSSTDTFRLMFPDKTLSPEFEVTHWNGYHPLHYTDTVRVEYRVWDSQTLRVRVLSGNSAGWTHRWTPDGPFATYATGIVVLGSLLWLAVQWKEHRDDEDDSTAERGSDIQSLGL